MIEKKPKDPLLENIKTALDESCEHLDGGTLSRLRQAREQAISKAAQPSLWQKFKIPATALATATTAVFVVFFYLGSPNDMSNLHSSFDDIEILMSEESPDFYEELDFYSWLAEEQDSAA